MAPPDIVRHEPRSSLPSRQRAPQEVPLGCRLFGMRPAMMQHMIDKFLAYPLVPATLVLCWLALEWLALRRLRRERRQRTAD